MGHLTTDLPGQLSQRKVLVETLTYIAVELDTDGWIAAADVAAWPVREQSEKGRGLQVIRSTEEGWAHEPGAVVTEVRILVGTALHPAYRHAAVLVNCPDDAFHFLEQYAPEVVQTWNDFEQEQADAPLSIVVRSDR